LAGTRANHNLGEAQAKVLAMDEEPTINTENLRDAEQLVIDIKKLISRIELLRARIALYLLLTEFPP
jgi:hypothetical protein